MKLARGILFSISQNKKKPFFGKMEVRPAIYERNGLLYIQYTLAEPVLPMDLEEDKSQTLSATGRSRRCQRRLLSMDGGA